MQLAVLVAPAATDASHAFTPLSAAAGAPAVPVAAGSFCAYARPAAIIAAPSQTTLNIFRISDSALEPERSPELYTTELAARLPAVSRFPHTRFLISAAAAAQFPSDYGTEVAFAGRSNAGKSSAINAISGRSGLARASKTPGRTRLLNFFELKVQRRIVDLPGYGYASAPQEDRERWLPLLDQLRARRSLRGMILVVDSRRGLMDGDRLLLDWAEAGGCALHILLSKVDKLKRSESQSVLNATRAALANRGTVQLFSATHGTGVEEAQQVLEDLFSLKDPDDLLEIAGAD